MEQDYTLHMNYAGTSVPNWNHTLKLLAFTPIALNTSLSYVLTKQNISMPD